MTMGIHMPLIEWRPQLETGLAEIDSQHKTLVDMINSLAAFSLLETDRVIIEDTIHQLIDYASFHFSLEETLMKEAAFHEYPLHRAEHASFAMEIMHMSSKAFGNGTTIGDISDYLKKWLIKHILTTDMQYVEALQKHGIQ